MDIEEYKKFKLDLLTIYRNYLFSLQEREEYGEKYGDTCELIGIYEKILVKYKILKEDHSKD